MRNAISSVLSHGWIALALLAVAVVSFRVWMVRPVMEFSSAAQSSYVSAPPGADGSITLSMEKLRANCSLAPAATELIVYDTSGDGFKVNQRSGLRSMLGVRGHIDRTIKFEVPRFAVPGMGYVGFVGVFDCSGYTVVQRTPSYPFEILEGR